MYLFSYKALLSLIKTSFIKCYKKKKTAKIKLKIPKKMDATQTPLVFSINQSEPSTFKCILDLKWLPGVLNLVLIIDYDTRIYFFTFKTDLVHISFE